MSSLYPRSQTSPAGNSAGLPAINSLVDDNWRRSLADPRTHSHFMSMLGKVPIFQQMSETFRKAVVQSLRPVDYQKGATVFNQGDSSDWMGILLRGELECRVQSEKGEARNIKGVMPGGTIGDVNVFGIMPKRCVTVVAAAASTVLVLPRTRFDCAVATSKDSAAFEATSRMRDKLTMDVDAFCELECFKKLGFDHDFVSSLFGYVERRLLYPGCVVMHEGSCTREMYILEVGQIGVEKNRKHVVNLSDGASFGFLSALGSQNQATVVCKSHCMFTVISGEILSATLERFPHCKGAVHHAYVKTLVTHGLHEAKEEMQQLDMFYGRVHPLSTEQLMDSGLGGLGGFALAQKHQKQLQEARSKKYPWRPASARNWPPRKIPSRPCSAMEVRAAAGSPILLPPRPETSCE